MHLFKQACMFKQAAKTDAEECEPFQKLIRNLRPSFPDHESRTEKFIMTEKRHSNLRKSVITLLPKGFLSRTRAEDCLPIALRLGQRLCRAGGENFSSRSPS